MFQTRSSKWHKDALSLSSDDVQRKTITRASFARLDADLDAR